MNYYLLTRDNYFGRTYGMSFIEKMKMLIFWKKIFLQNFYLFLDTPLILSLIF